MAFRVKLSPLEEERKRSGAVAKCFSTLSDPSFRCYSFLMLSELLGGLTRLNHEYG
jgi:hypothetical protein